jgi:hypothetical protein
VTTEPDNLLAYRRNRMQQINIKLERNDEMRDWSVEIDGQRHEHVTSDLVEALVECELIVAETSLTDPQRQDRDSFPAVAPFHR